MPVANDQRLRNRIAERADADLQGAPIGHQTRRVQADRVIGGTDFAVGRRKHGVCRHRVGNDDIKKVGRDFGRVRHERHLPVDDADDQQWFIRGARAFDHFKRNIGIARERKLQCPAFSSRRHRLRKHVHALHRHVACDERVVGANVMLLGDFVAEVIAGFHEKFVHFNVCRQSGTAQVGHVIQLGIVFEHARHQRRQKVLFKFTFAHRFLQRQRGNDAQPARGIRLDSAIECVDKRIRFADAKGNAEDDVALDRFKHEIDAGFNGIGKSHCVHGGASLNQAGNATAQA